MKKIIIFAIVLFMIFTLFVACTKTDGEVTLENMKKTLTNAGYKINENYAELYGFYELSMNSIDGFSFVFPGAHGKTNTPVLEFQDNASAEAYAEIVKMSDDFLAIVNDRFLTIVEAHHGVPHENEKIFLENLINGKPIK